MEAKAVAKYVGIPPRKLRLAANAVRGKKVEDALGLLGLSASVSAGSVAKVIKSAAANAENKFQVSSSELRIARICIDTGPTLKRMRPQARGRVSRILKHSSHITVVVEEKED